MFKVSIVTVCFNMAATIRDTVESVLSQNYPAIEYIVVDGDSRDGTLGIVRSYGDNKIAKIISERDLGIYDAMNKGISLATGDVIGFLNADDFYSHNGVLASVAQYFVEDPSLNACYSDLIYTSQVDTSRMVRYWQSSEFVPGVFSTGWCPPHPTFFARRSIYERFGGFDFSYRIAADVELMMRYLEVHKIRVRYVPEVWVKMRLGGTTNKNLKNIWIQNQEILRALRNHGLPASPVRFFANKFLSRGKQFLQRPAA